MSDNGHDRFEIPRDMRAMAEASLDQARQTGLFDAIAFSSDSDSLLATALKAGADIAVAS